MYCFPTLLLDSIYFYQSGYAKGAQDCGEFKQLKMHKMHVCVSQILHLYFPLHVCFALLFVHSKLAKNKGA